MGDDRQSARFIACRCAWHMFLLLAFLLIAQRGYHAGEYYELQGSRSATAVDSFISSEYGTNDKWPQYHYTRHLMGSTNSNDFITTNLRREIFLVGDSLMAFPESYFSISSKLREEMLKDYPSGTEVIVKSFAAMHYKIHNVSMGIQEILNSRLLNGKPMPDAIFLYCYSDMVDEFNSEATPEENERRESHYRKSLTHLLKFLSHLDVKHVAVVGPSLYGGHGEMPSSWVGVHSVLLDNYVKINKEVCEEFSRNSIHLDSRTTFRQYIQDQAKQTNTKPRDLSHLAGLNWKNSDVYNDGQMGGILTFDGEHTNLEGTALLMYMFVDQLRRWEKDPPLSPLYPMRPQSPPGNRNGEISSSSSSRRSKLRSSQEAVPKSILSILGADVMKSNHVPTVDNPSKEPGNFFARLFSMTESKKQFASQEDAFAQELSAMGDQDGSLEAYGDQNHQPTPAELLKGEIPSAELSGSNLEEGAMHSDTGLNKNPSPQEGNYLEPGDEGTAPLDSPPSEDDRSTWSAEKRACFEWRDTFGVIVGISWNRLPFELQVKWEQFNCNEYMDCHTAACSYHSGTLEHYQHDHPVYVRPKSAGDWEMENGFIPPLPTSSELAPLKKKTSTDNLVPKLKSIESVFEEGKFLKPDEEKLRKIHHHNHHIVENIHENSSHDQKNKDLSTIAKKEIVTSLPNKKVFVEPLIDKDNAEVTEIHGYPRDKAIGSRDGAVVSPGVRSGYHDKTHSRIAENPSDSSMGKSKDHYDILPVPVHRSSFKKKSGSGGLLTDLFESVHPLLMSSK